MLKEFGIKNYFGFKEGAVISFEFDKNVPEDISECESTGRVLGIKGANGSGKTNLIKAIGFISDFVTKSADKDIDSKIEVDTFFGNEEASEFYVSFDFNENSYIYELSVLSGIVLKESLWKNNKRKTLILQREKDEIYKAIKPVEEIKKLKLKSNASVVSMHSKFNFKSEMVDFDNFYSFFSGVLTNVGYTGLTDSLTKVLNFDFISEQYSKDKELFNFVKEVIITSDLGIKDITIFTREDEKGKTVYFPGFTHENNNKEKMISIYDESSGTQQLYRSMYLYWLSLKMGGLLALDEFDIHLHALILPKVLNLFLDKDKNKEKAQFIFTSHNTEIIDALGKYRTVLVNKEENESYCYRLDELPSTLVRNDRALSPLYIKGKLGGVPNL